MTVELSILAPHVPSICHEEMAPEFQKDIIAGLKEVGKKIDSLKTDAIVMVSCHWPSTFHHYVNCTPVHEAVLTANECPDLINDVSYYYPGDPELGKELVKSGEAAGLQVVGFNDPHYIWDYGSVVPLRYLVPKGDIPVINLSVTLAANLEETYNWGKQIAKVIHESKKNIVFISSGALSHNLVRGRENLPTSSEHAMDKEFTNFIMNKNYTSAYEMLPQYSRAAKVESGGRHLAMLLGVLEEDSRPKYFADGQSSGSWNALVTFENELSKKKKIEEKELSK